MYKYIYIVNRVMLLINELRARLKLNKGSSKLEPLLCPVVQSHT
jgi:hypothetical protein